MSLCHYARKDLSLELYPLAMGYDMAGKRNLHRASISWSNGDKQVDKSDIRRDLRLSIG